MSILNFKDLISPIQYMLELQWTLSITILLGYNGAHGRVVKASDLRSRGHGFDSRPGHVYKALGKLWNPHCLGPPSRNGYLAQQIQGWIVSCKLQDALTCRGERQSPLNMPSVDIWSINKYLYL